MATSLIASNASVAAGKWVPYLWKPFNLGRAIDGQGSTDGNIHITQTTGDSGVGMIGWCISSHNCGYYYLIKFGSTGGDHFYIEKYDLNNNQVDTIYASETGESDDGKWWNKTATTKTIDIGVIVCFKSTSSYDTGDVYKIILPSEDTMDRRRIYHGGYSAFIRMPYTEGIVYHSDIIPCDLKGKSMNINLGCYLTGEAGLSSSQAYLTTAASMEDSTGNQAVTAGLEWNVEPEAVHSNVADEVATVDFSVEKWQLGTIFYDDINPNSGTDLLVNTHAPISDMTPAAPFTGEVSSLNTTVSGRAGHAKMYLAYNTGVGSPTINAYNQFWPVTITLT
jgi:hypothetical protein